MRQNQKGRILEVSAQVFEEKGYDKASIKDIADRLGMSKPNLYHYFKGKNQILYIIIKTQIEPAIERLEKIMEKPIPPQEKMREAILAHFQAYKDNFPEMLVIFHEKIGSLQPRYYREIKKKYKNYTSLWLKIIREGVSKGIFRDDLDDKILVWAVLGMCNWVYKWGSINGRLSFGQIARTFHQLFLEGVLVQ